MKIFDYLEKRYLNLPQSYFKLIIKNILGFSINTFSFQKEKITFDNISFYVYKNRLTKNDELLKDSYYGYIRYYHIKKDDIIIDVGPYAGIFTIYAAIKVGSKGKVIAFEPDPYTYIILKRNIKLNKLKNVIVVKKGLYDKDAKLAFDIQGPPSNIIPKYKKVLTFNYIRTTTLDKELQKLKFGKVNFIKMDIEGAEIKALLGAQKTIKNNPNINLAIACYHIVDGQQTSIKLKKILANWGLKVWFGNKNHPVLYAKY